MLSRLHGRAAIATLACTLPLTAQTVGAIAVGSATSNVSSMSSWRRAVVRAPDGTLWALVRDDANGGQLWLTASADGGANWGGRFDVPTGGDGAGAIALDRADCRRLHVAWSALDGGAFSDAFHQEFDLATASFVGQPTRLTAASGANDQYYVNDVAATESGHVVVGINTHRAPPTTVWRGGWSAGLFHRRPGSATFDPVQQVNTDSFGMQIDLQPVGDVVHTAFRTNTGLYGIRYRGYDCVTGTFTTAGDVQVATGTSNVSQIAAAADGDLYVLYASGGTSAGSGEIRIAHAAASDPTTWTSQQVAVDADLLRGNVTDVHYSLATDGTDAVYAIYSRATGEQFANLWFRVFAGGIAVSGETPLATSSDPDRYRVVAGLRDPAVTASPACVVESRAAIHPGRRVEFVRFGSAGRAVRYGIACQGSRPTPPRLAVGAQPVRGGTLDLVWSGAPANTPAALLFAAACRTPALDLDRLGFTGCRLELDAPGSGGLVTDASGRARITLSIPPNPSYAGVAFQLQSLVVAPGANPGGAVLTAALSVVVD